MMTDNKLADTRYEATIHSAGLGPVGIEKHAAWHSEVAYSGKTTEMEVREW